MEIKRIFSKTSPETSKNDLVAIENAENALLKRFMLTSLVTVLITATVVIILLELSGYPGTMNDTQLGFDAGIVKSYFALMSPEDMTFFILGNLADYAFMVSYGCFFYSCAKYLSRNYRKGSILQKIGGTVAWIGLLSAACDAVENVFLLSMTADPAGFPSWLAIAHSTFAVFKFTLMYVTAGWLIISFILNRTPLTARMLNKVTGTDLDTRKPGEKPVRN
ncbi:MAG: hypothetical protein ACFFD4_14815 [Candidatus Odinarchaeota archaeon]